MEQLLCTQRLHNFCRAVMEQHLPPTHVTPRSRGAQLLYSRVCPANTEHREWRLAAFAGSETIHPNHAIGNHAIPRSVYLVVSTQNAKRTPR